MEILIAYGVYCIGRGVGSKLDSVASCYPLLLLLNDRKQIKKKTQVTCLWLVFTNSESTTSFKTR